MAKKRDTNWFKFYYLRFLASTTDWTDEMVGAYIRLLIYQFDRGALPNDEKKLKKMITSFKKSWPELQKKFQSDESGGFLKNEFMDEIYNERNFQITKNQQNGKKGGIKSGKRWVQENEATGYTYRDNISISISPSSSKEDRGVGEETETPEKVELSSSGFWTNEFDRNTQLSLLDIGNVKTFIQLTCKTDLTDEFVMDQWEAFKINQCDQRTWKNSYAEFLQHFRNSIRNQITNSNGKQSTGSKSRRVSQAESSAAVTGDIQESVKLLRSRGAGSGTQV